MVIIIHIPYRLNRAQLCLQFATSASLAWTKHIDTVEELGQTGRGTMSTSVAKVENLLVLHLCLALWTLRESHAVAIDARVELSRLEGIEGLAQMMAAKGVESARQIGTSAASAI